MYTFLNLFVILSSTVGGSELLTYNHVLVVGAYAPFQYLLSIHVVNVSLFKLLSLIGYSVHDTLTL